MGFFTSKNGAQAKPTIELYFLTNLNRVPE